MEISVTIDLQDAFTITKIRYNPGDVQRAETWNADEMISPFGTNRTTPGTQWKGAWTEQIGSPIRASKITIKFRKTRTQYANDWLMIGEVEVFGYRENRPRSAIEEIVDQLIADDAFSRQCVEEAGGISEAVTIKNEDLNFDGQPEFFVTGKRCGLGPRRPDAWYYRKVAKGYEQILYINQGDNFVKLKTRTKGYVDLKVTSSIGRDTFGEDIYKFDGNLYQSVSGKCVGPLC